MVSGYGSLHWPFSCTFLGADDNTNCKVFLTSSLYLIANSLQYESYRKKDGRSYPPV